MARDQAVEAARRSPVLEAPASTMATVAGLAAERFGDRPALLAAEGWPLSYRELDRLSDEAAIGLAATGVRPGAVVNLLLPSRPEYLVAYLAIAKLGAITSGINPRLTPAERTALVGVADPTHVVGTAELLEGVDVGGRTVLEVTISDSPGGLLRELRRDGTAPAPFDGGPDHPVAIVFTSGTTQTPRGAVFGNAQLAASAIAESDGRWGGGAKLLGSNTQFAHVGLMAKLHWYMRTGSTMLLLHRWRAADALRLIAEHRLPAIGGVAPQIALMVRDPTFDDYDWDFLQLVSGAAAPSSPALITEAKRRFGALYSNRYSCTESGVATKSDPNGPDEEVLYTVGKPYGDTELSIHDEDGRPVPDGDEGEIWLRSAQRMIGYWHNAEATRLKLTEDGWVRTGDLGYIDELGNLRMVGRGSEIYIRGGYNVSPVHVESALSTHPSVAAVAIAPLPDDVMGEIGIATVVARAGAEPPSLAELRAFGGDRLADYELPEGLLMIPELPLTAMMKVDRRALAGVVREHQAEIDRHRRTDRTR